MKSGQTRAWSLFVHQFFGFFSRSTTGTFGPDDHMRLMELRMKFRL